MKEDSDAVVGEGTEAAGGGLDHLDLGVESFGDGIGDAVYRIAEKA